MLAVYLSRCYDYSRSYSQEITIFFNTIGFLLQETENRNYNFLLTCSVIRLKDNYKPCYHEKCFVFFRPLAYNSINRL